MFKKGDIILAFLLLIIAFASAIGFYFYKTGNSDVEQIAVIKQDDKIIKKINLNDIEENERITISNKFNNTILIEKGRIRFEESTCPDHICVKTGWLDESGEIAVCLPNQVIVKIEGLKDELDGETY